MIPLAMRMCKKRLLEIYINNLKRTFIMEDFVLFK